MSELWRFVRQKRNREVLGWLGGGLVVVAAGVWAVIIYLSPPHMPSKPNPINVQANCGGVAIGGDVAGATVTAGATTSTDCSMKPK
jgi:hypothetical protein